MAFFSVIIPVYNLEKYILQTAKCFFNQTFGDFEIIFVDDGSTDKTVEILKKIKDERIKVIQIQKSNAGHARNVGLKEANGEWVLFFDGDDFCKVDFLKTIAEKIENCVDLPDILFCASYEYMEKSKKMSFKRKTHLFSGVDSEFASRTAFLTEINSRDVFHLVEPWTKFYRKSFLCAGGFEFQEIDNSNDTAFFYQTLFANPKILFEFKSFVISRRGRKGALTKMSGKRWRNYFEAYKSADSFAFNYSGFEEIKEFYLERKMEVFKYFFKKTGIFSRVLFLMKLLGEIEKTNKLLGRKEYGICDFLFNEF